MSEALSNATQPDLWGTFLDINNDVKPWLRKPVSDTSIDANLQLITDMACSWVQNYCQRPFAPKTFDRRFDGWAGWNGAYIMLPYYPVLEVISVVEYWGISGPHDLSESTPTAQIDGYQLVPGTGRINRVFPGNVQKPFFPGTRNIEIVWTAGYNPIPPDVKVATLEMINYWVRNTQQMAPNARSTSLSEYDGNGGTGTLWAGIPERVEALLDPFVTVGMG